MSVPLPSGKLSSAVLFRSTLLVVLLSGSVLFPQVPTTGQKPAVPAPPPLPPPPISFRQLMEMSAAEREPILATRSPQQRQIVEAKLREYESLPREEREARLCTLQLRLYLRPLLEMAPSNRLARLPAVPQPDRKLVEQRLQFWDQLPLDVQKDFLNSEAVLAYIFRPETAVHNLRMDVPQVLRDRIEKGIDGWNQLPEPKRREILENFEKVFGYSAKEKARVLDKFSDTERRQMQKSLQTFERLPKAKRDRCVNGFQRFAGLSAEERQQFLSNAELWQTMNPKDRLAWQSLVSRISIPRPPLPAEFNSPPLPPKALPAPSSILTTNN